MGPENLGEQHMKPQDTRSNSKQELQKSTYIEPLWTVEDVANYLRLRQETVRMMARTNKIPALKVGRVWRFRINEIKEMLKEKVVVLD
jgi:excisionase family DNA binding protein